MRAILIDPKRRRVLDVELSDKGKRQSVEIRKLIGAEFLDHQRISDVGDYLWLDEFGLTRQTCFAFKLRSAGPFAGRGIIIGTGPDRRAYRPRVTLAMIQNDVDWLGEIEPELHWEQKEITGPNGEAWNVVRNFVTYKRVGP